MHSAFLTRSVKLEFIIVFCAVLAYNKENPEKGECSMKKFVAMLCVFCLVLGLCACGGEGQQETQPTAASLQVGFGKASLMPEEPVPMAGYTDTTKRMLDAAGVKYTRLQAATKQITIDLVPEEEQ